MTRRALITGAGSGIGRAAALALAKAGHLVCLAGRREAPLAAVHEAIALRGGRSEVLAGFDVSDPDRVADGVRRALQAGDVAVLVNCAGAAPSAPFAKTNLELWSRTLAVNLTGAMLVTQAVLPSLRRAGHGRIINVASTAGLKGYPYVSAYCAAKHGLVGLTRALALELARTDVTVNAVCPGFTETDLLEDALSTIVAQTGRSVHDARANLLRSNPQGRFVAPEEVADAIVWLSSQGAGAITGQAIPVAGGEVTGG
jgi:NAD(P)-dependent dehydrogenase (short-subunit alcohol dehydrogenase family)